MFRKKFWAVLVFAGFVCTGAIAAECAHPERTVDYEMTEISENGLVAAFYAPKEEGRHPALLVLGGSEGGTRVVRLVGAAYAEQGYAVLALSYFGAEGLPEHMQEIPLEYFSKAVDWLSARSEVRKDRIGVAGASKGAEAALLAASRDERIRAVIATVPSHVVWQNINMTDFTPRSSWTEKGEPLPYVRYVMDDGFKSIFALYDDALPVAPDSPAIIPVEKINGPIMLISGRADTLWPSTKMADRIMDRLKAHNFPHNTEHLAYEDAGHGAATPPSLGAIYGGPDSFVGGSEEGNAVAREDSWAKRLCFLTNSLKK